MIRLEQKNDMTPLCPHCAQSIAEVWYRELRSAFGRRYIYFCARCRKVLGISHRKGFWMG
jgi:hypothetical protein